MRIDVPDAAFMAGSTANLSNDFAAARAEARRVR
jgi:hypothetical protein